MYVLLLERLILMEEKIVQKNKLSIIRILSFPINILLIISLFAGCCANTTTKYQPVEQPHLYWKDIDVTVTNVDKRHWFAGTHWYEVTVYVHSDEYDLDGSYTEKGSGVFGCPNSWQYETGDTVKAELYSWVMDSTGEVIKRKINKVY